jgi:uncharacterized phage protein (TIGR01671 family)
MREIKFRAWDGKVMYVVDVLAISECTWSCPDYGKRGVSLAYQPYIEVMQYTGIEDKNDKEIYEGDIVKRTCDLIGAEDEGFIGIIKFECGAFLLESLDGESGRYLWDDAQELEVLGNIHEGKEKARA